MAKMDESAEMDEPFELDDANLEKIAGGRWKDVEPYARELEEKYGVKLDMRNIVTVLTKEELEKFRDMYLSNW